MFYIYIARANFAQCLHYNDSVCSFIEYFNIVIFPGGGTAEDGCREMPLAKLVSKVNDDQGDTVSNAMPRSIKAA